MTITVSTDGSALGNPNGPMGWAWADHAANAARTNGHQHDGDSDAGGATNGTNQIGELCAVLEALRAHRGAEPLTIETDSQYAINCSTTWVKGWKKNGWKNSQKKPVKNAPLIKAIDAEIARREGPVKFVWVKGHNGNPGNEKVDDLAHTYSGDARSGVKDGYLPLEGWQSLLASTYAKGVDIPADAKMLIEGKITEEQYHLGRGTQSDDGSDDEDQNDSVNHANVHKPTLSERLAQPEGVPEYDFSPRKPVVSHHQAAGSDEPTGENAHHDEDGDKPHTIGRSVRSQPNFSTSSVGDDVTIPADRSKDPTETELPIAGESGTSGISRKPAERDESATDDETGRETEATASPESENNGNATDTTANHGNGSAASDNNKGNENNATGHRDENIINADRDDNHESGELTSSSDAVDDNAENNEAGTDAESNTSAADTVDDANAKVATNENGETVTPRVIRSTPKTNPKPRYFSNGLCVNGTLRFSPAPQTSPTYNGRPRHIRGVIAIDGYVAGNGAITLNNVPFLIMNENHKK